MASQDCNSILDLNSAGPRHKIIRRRIFCFCFLSVLLIMFEKGRDGYPQIFMVPNNRQFNALYKFFSHVECKILYIN